MKEITETRYSCGCMVEATAADGILKIHPCVSAEHMYKELMMLEEAEILSLGSAKYHLGQRHQNAWNTYHAHLKLYEIDVWRD